MAIPGYATNYGYDYSESEYYDYVASMVGILGNTHAEVIEKVKNLRAEIVAKADFNVLLPNGQVDLSKIRAPTLDEVKNADIEVVCWDGAGSPAASGFVNGKFCLFFGAAAEAFIKQWSLPIDEALVAPRLKITSISGLTRDLNSMFSFEIETFLFGATFMTKWGETQPSNIVKVYAMIGEGDAQFNWQLTLEVEDEYIPSYATSVRYYRYYDVFRLIREVGL